MKWDVDDFEVEVIKVSLRQTEYEEQIVHLVRSLLEIDELSKPAHDIAIIEGEAA